MKFQILIIAILSTLTGTAQKAENDLIQQNLKGRVSSISISEYSVIVKFGEAQKSSLESKSLYKYNDYGNITEWNLFNSDGSLFAKFTSKHDNNGNRTESNNYNSDGSLKSKSIWTYKYDEKGNKKEEICFHYDSNDRFLDKLIWVFKYDDKGYLYEQIGGISDSLYDRKFIYKYDSIGNVTEEEYLNKTDENLNSKETYKYNSSDNRVENKSYNSQGSLETKWSYRYNNNGDITEEEYFSYTINGSNAKTTYEYDEYDKTENWIKRKQLFNDKPITIIEREIEYF